MLALLQKGRHPIVIGDFRMPAFTVQQTFELALQHHQAGRFAAAEALYRQILTVQPAHADAFYNLGVISLLTGSYDRAIDWIRKAIILEPSNSNARANLGEAYRRLGRFDEAIAAFRSALEVEPDHVAAHNNLGIALTERGHIDAAIVEYRRAIEIRPDFAEAYCNLGNALARLNQCDAAAATYRRALELKPDYPLAQNNLGLALTAQGQLDEAIDVYRHALRLKPANHTINSNLIYALHFHPATDRRTIAGEQQQWNRQFSDPIQRFRLPHTNPSDPERRLRIGYVSPDFREHVVGRNLLPLIRRHGYQNVVILCYSAVSRPDSLTEEFRHYAVQWSDTTGTRDKSLAEMIRKDGVDILVDLTQHMAGNRLPVFAWEPAPVQLSFAGYPESTGLEAIRYRLSDRWLESDAKPRKPVPASEVYSDDSPPHIPWIDCGHERVYLINSFWCYDPGEAETMVNDLPAKRNGRITFGSLNNFGKINDLVLQLWARVLVQVRNSRLILLSGYGSHRQRTLEFLATHGVEPACVEFVAPCPRKDYLELYHRLDIALDPFPYGGHTTSLDALWMGVPVVSLAGERPVSRAGLSILNNLGLPELVTFSQDEYVKIAVDLANDLPRLAELRQTLRTRMENSLLMDAPHFARQIEAAYRAMWREWCAKQDSWSPSAR